MSGPSRISVGLLYNPHVPYVLERAPDRVDHLSVVPDILQVDRRRRGGGSSRPRFVDVELVTRIVDAAATEWPMVGHGVGLSIGSPGPIDSGYLGRMRSWVERLGLLWYSEHLSFFRLPRGSTAAHEAGLACPLPCDRDIMNAIARRAAAVQSALGVPFLLENSVSYVQPVDDDLSEAAFLNGVCTQAKTATLLDLHNLYVNARNLGVDGAATCDALVASSIREIHVAGGDMLLEYYTDAHSGAVPEEVWQLLRHVLPRLKNLRAITFEYHESVGPRLSVDGVLGQLERAREEVARVGRATGRHRKRAVKRDARHVA